MIGLVKIKAEIWWISSRTTVQRIARDLGQFRILVTTLTIFQLQRKNH